MTVTDLHGKQLPLPGPAASLATPRVVVAVDTRPSSVTALAWAADEALCRGMSLRIVTAFADAGQQPAPRTVEQAMDLQRRLRRQLESNRPWLDEAELVVRRGNAHALLAEAASDTDIVVVGETAGVGATDPAYRLPCPVVIVPAAPADG